jgi:hypothetical protein
MLVPVQMHGARGLLGWLEHQLNWSGTMVLGGMRVLNATPLWAGFLDPHDWLIIAMAFSGGYVLVLLAIPIIGILFWVRIARYSNQLANHDLERAS